MAADSTCSLKFGPEWIRVLSDSSSGQTHQPQPSQAAPPRKYPLAKHRYGKEELIAIYEQTLYGNSVPPLSTPGFNFCDGVYIEQTQTPRSLIPMTDEEQRLWAFQRVAPSRGRGRGITPAPWAAARSAGGHLQQTRNWRSPEKPTSTSQPPMSAGSQFNYWRKNSLNDDEKVPEWADEKVSEDNDNVGSFDEKGGFLSLENRGRTIEGVVGVPSPGNSFMQRPTQNVESDLHMQATVHAEKETNSTKTSVDTPRSPPLQSERKVEALCVSDRLQRDANDKEPNDISLKENVHCAAVINSPTTSRSDDMRSPLAQNKRAQVVILSSGGASSMDSIPTTAVVEQDATQAVDPERPLQQNTQWSSPNRDISEAPLWYYKDPQGIIQGPFSSADMLEWSNQGYFHDSLECRRTCDHVFNPLGALKKVWNGTLPFYLPSFHGPISTLLLHNASTTPPKMNAAFNVSLGLGVISPNTSPAMNGFMASSGQGMNSAAVPSVSPISAAMNSSLCSEAVYFEDTSAQFNKVSQAQNDFECRNRQLANDSGVGNESMGVGHSPPANRVQLEAETRAGVGGGAASNLAHSILESSIRRSVHDHPFNQTVNNHMTANNNTTSNHRRGIISNRLLEHVNTTVSSQSTRSTTTTTAAVAAGAAPSLEQQADSSWFNSARSDLNVGYRGEMIPQSVASVVDQAAQHRTITQHEFPNSWMVQQKNERNNAESSSRASHHEETKHVGLDEVPWNDFEYGDHTIQTIASFDDEQSQHLQQRSQPHLQIEYLQQQLEQQLQKQQHLTQQQQQQSQQKRQTAEFDEKPQESPAQHQKATASEEVPFEKVVEKKKKRDRKEKQREERLLREKQERDINEQKKHTAQQNSTDEEIDWDCGEQSAGKMSLQDVIIPAPAPAIPAWGKPDTNLSALGLHEIQRLEEERASRERQQRQQEAVKNGYHSGIRTWANAIAPTKSFDQIQKEQQASKAGGAHTKQQPKGTPMSYPPLSAANVVANGIGAPAKSSKSAAKSPPTVQQVRNSVPNSHNNNNNNHTVNNHHSINNINNAGEKSVQATETTTNEQQLIDWCAQITKGLNSYLDMPTVVSILKDVESEAEIEDYVSQFFGDSLKEPRQFARQFVQKRAKFNVGLASSLPKQSEWCTTGGNKKRKGTKK